MRAGRSFAAALAAAVLAAGPVSAMTFTAKDVGRSRTVTFDGMVDGRPVPALGATVTVTLTSAAKGRFVFSYRIANTSGAPVSASRVSLFGFDIDRDVADATATGALRLLGTGRVPGLGQRDVCMGREDHDRCDRGTGGVRLGRTGAGTFWFVGVSGGAIGFDNLFVRYEDVVAPSLALDDADGVGQPVIAPPAA